MLRYWPRMAGHRRRRLAGGLVAVVVAIMAAGCGGGTAAPTAAPTEPPAPPPSALPTEPPAATSAPIEAPAPTATSAPTETAVPTATTAPASPTASQAMVLLPCSAASLISLVQTPVPTTPPPTATPSSITPTPRPATPTPRPAPQEDRVGFPEGYQEDFKLFYIYERADNKQVRVVCGNDAAVSVKPGEPLPHGSILVMETWRARLDADGKVMTDENGRYIRENLSGLFVMRKEPGFGADYQDLRTGEWEYVAYRLNKEHLVPPANTANCAACHMGAGQERDWVFRGNLFFEDDKLGSAPTAGPDEVRINSMAFGPSTLSVKAGTTITWINDDVVPHTVTADDGAFDSGLLQPGESFSYTFNDAGSVAYHCSLHPLMRAKLEVSQ